MVTDLITRLKPGANGRMQNQRVMVSQPALSLSKGTMIAGDANHW
jgi:hypothetical protein